ncbi:trans-sialidase [Trypanosoma cruzi]|nr:trans-sialidase [Trypanosoma cruzi]
MLCSCFYFFASCVCRHTQQHAHCSGFGCFFFSVCWRLRVAAASFSGHEGKEERECTASHLSCGCDAPPTTALSRAPSLIVGVMAGNFVATSWLGEELLLRAALCVIASSVCVVCRQRAVAVSCWSWD